MPIRPLNAIRKYRLLHTPPLRQRDIAEMLGVATTLISKYELGKAIPTLQRAFEIALALKVPVDRVFFALHETAGTRVRRPRNTVESLSVIRPVTRLSD